MGNATTIMGIIQNDGAIKKEKKTKIRGIPRALIKFLAMELGQLSGIPSKSIELLCWPLLALAYSLFTSNNKHHQIKIKAGVSCACEQSNAASRTH